LRVCKDNIKYFLEIRTVLHKGSSACMDHHDQPFSI
jgi:hypothetical protein